MNRFAFFFVALFVVFSGFQSVFAQNQLEIYMDGSVTHKGNQLLIPIKVKGFTDVRTMQFTLEWDPQGFSYKKVSSYGVSGLGEGNFGTNRVDNGVLTVSWDDPSGGSVSLADGEKIFILRLEVIGKVWQDYKVQVTGSPTAIEFTDRNGDEFSVVSTPGVFHINDPEAVKLSVKESVGLWRESVEVPITASHFQGVKGMSFTLSWDKSLADFVDVTGINIPGVDVSNFKKNFLGHGLLGFDWDGTTPVSLDPNAELFRVILKLKGDPGSEFPVKFTDEYIGYDFLGEDDSKKNYYLTDSKVSVATQGEVRGKVLDLDGKPVPGVSVASELPETTALTDTEGSFKLILEANQAHTVQVTSKVEELSIENIDIVDVLAIRRHVAGVESIDAKERFVAADVNSDEQVSLLDLNSIKEIVLGSKDRFEGEQGVFKTKEYEGAPKEWPSEINLTADALWSGVDFLKIPFGDVVRSSTENESIQKFSLKGTRDGNKVVLAFQAEEFESVAGFQTCLKWDVDKIEFKSAEKSGLDLSFFQLADKSGLRVLWDSPSGKPETLTEESPIAKLEFVLKDEDVEDVSALFSWGDNAFPSKAVTAGLEVMEMEFLETDVELVVHRDFLFPPRPNPVVGKSVLEFDLVNGGDVALELVNLEGKVVWSGTIKAEPGRTTLEWEPDSALVSGWYILRLMADGFVATERLLLQR
ncbi:hypothetical protein FUAX_12850 [Fulvitalea axinellae]|uniref:Uncharacterized protein n=1 Tax=Fulvitalea axinellae TaxID=1182444 RepID=A0AAU9CLC7_9BACT|nr:hypothetical protein FUAX_12850 [Fulvitalea axinellae]